MALGGGYQNVNGQMMATPGAIGGGGAGSLGGNPFQFGAGNASMPYNGSVNGTQVGGYRNGMATPGGVGSGGVFGGMGSMPGQPLPGIGGGGSGALNGAPFQFNSGNSAASFPGSGMGSPFPGFANPMGQQSGGMGISGFGGMGQFSLGQPTQAAVNAGLTNPNPPPPNVSSISQQFTTGANAPPSWVQNLASGGTQSPIGQTSMAAPSQQPRDMGGGPGSGFYAGYDATPFGGAQPTQGGAPAGSTLSSVPNMLSAIGSPASSTPSTAGSQTAQPISGGPQTFKDTGISSGNMGSNPIGQLQFGGINGQTPPPTQGTATPPDQGSISTQPLGGGMRMINGRMMATPGATGSPTGGMGSSTSSSQSYSPNRPGFDYNTMLGMQANEAANGNFGGTYSNFDVNGGAGMGLAYPTTGTPSNSYFINGGSGVSPQQYAQMTEGNRQLPPWLQQQTAINI